MCKLIFSHEITDLRNFGKERVNQSMDVVVNYDPETNDAEVLEVNIYQEGKKVCEISTLLDKAEGSPLCAILEGIDWREQYEQTREAVEDLHNDAA